MMTKKAGDVQEPHLGLLGGTTTGTGTFVIQELKKFASLSKAGLQAGDEIISFGPMVGAALEQNQTEIVALVARLGVGGTIPVKFKRAGKVADVMVKLVAKKNLNLSLEDVDLELERKIAP